MDRATGGQQRARERVRGVELAKGAGWRGIEPLNPGPPPDAAFRRKQRVFRILGRMPEPAAKSRE